MSTPLDRAMKEHVMAKVDEALEHLDAGNPRGWQLQASGSDHQYFVLPSNKEGEPVRRASVHFSRRVGTSKVAIETVRPMVRRHEYNLRNESEKESARKDIEGLRREPGLLAEEAKALFAYLLNAGVTRDELVELLDTAVVESVLES